MDPLINTNNKPTFQTTTTSGAGTASNVDSTYVPDMAEGTESYKNCIIATEVVNKLLQEVPVREQALNNALNNQQTAFMVISYEMKNNSNYGNENPHLMALIAASEALTATKMALSNVDETFTTAVAPGGIREKYEKILKDMDGKLDRDLNAGDKTAAYQEAYLAWFALKGKYITPHKDKNGVVDGQTVDFVSWLAELGKLIDRFKGPDGTLATFSNKEEALAWAKENGGLPADLNSNPPRCIVESPPGTFKVMIDIKALENTRTSLKDYQAKQSAGGGFLSEAQYSALEGMLEVNQRALDTQTSKTIQLIKTYKEQIDANKQKVNDFLTAEAQWLEMVNR